MNELIIKLKINKEESKFRKLLTNDTNIKRKV